MDRSTGQKTKLAIIAILVAGCAVGHYLTPPALHPVHDLLFKLTYIQIILGGLWFGLRGGLTVSIVTSLLYVGHVEGQLGTHANPFSIYPDLVLYNVIAMLTGFLSDRWVRTTAQLERTVDELQEKTEALFRAEASLREADRMRALGELAAGMTHDLRTPLSGIAGAADILADPETTPEERNEFSDILKKECTRLDRVVENFLSFARRKEDAPLNLQEVDLGAVVSELLTLLKHPLEEQAIAVQTAIPSGLGVQADPDLLRQALLNLLVNSLQALGDKGGTIELNAAERGDRVCLEVLDDGPGIPAEVRDRLFDPFVTSRSGGTGLGLAITRKLLASIEADVQLVEDERDRTCFRVMLEKAEEE